MLSPLLIFGGRKTERKIIREGMISSTEKPSSTCGVVGPTGVCRLMVFSRTPGAFS